MAVRVGAQIQPQQASYRQMRDAWLGVEEVGADTLFDWGHFFPLYGARRRWSALSYLRPNLVRHADSYVENGITHLTVGIGGSDYDLSPLRELIAWRDEYRECTGENAAS